MGPGNALQVPDETAFSAHFGGKSEGSGAQLHPASPDLGVRRGRSELPEARPCQDGPADAMVKRVANQVCFRPGASLRSSPAPGEGAPVSRPASQVPGERACSGADRTDHNSTSRPQHAHQYAGAADDPVPDGGEVEACADARDGRAQPGDALLQRLDPPGAARRNSLSLAHPRLRSGEVSGLWLEHRPLITMGAQDSARMSHLIGYRSPLGGTSGALEGFGPSGH